jgi:alpha-L-arabinofuranosidase
MPVDLLTITLYTGEYFSRPRPELGDLTYYYRQVVNDPRKLETWLDRLIADVGDRFPKDRPLFAITEYNSFWIPENADADYRLCNALYLSGVFHALLRHANQVSLAEWNTLINVQGLISVNPREVKLTPPYFAYRLYRDHIGDQVLNTQTRSPSVSFNADLPALDALATLSADERTVFLAVINRSETEEVASSIQLQNWRIPTEQQVRTWELNGKDRDASNPFGSTENVNIRAKEHRPQQVPFAYRFPAHSVTVLEIPGGRQTR